MINVTDWPSVHTKTAHFLPADFETGRFRKGNSNRAHFENSIEETLENDENRAFLDAFGTRLIDLLGLRYNSLASKSCNEFFTVKFPTVFKMCGHRVTAVLNNSLNRSMSYSTKESGPSDTFIREIRSSGIKASITIVPIRKFYKMY